MHPVKLFLFKCMIYPVGVVCNIIVAFVLLFWAIVSPRKVFGKPTPRDDPPKCLLDPKWGKHGFLQLKDIKIHYVENGDREKPLMLMLHGFPEFWYSWRHQLIEFSKYYWVVAIDLRGYGESDKPESICSYKMAKVIDDIKSCIIELGREKCILVAHDWGGLLAWNFLDFYPEMVERFIIMDAPHHRTWTRMIIVNFRQFLCSWYCFFFQLPYLPEKALSFNDYSKLDSMKCSNDGSMTEEDVEVYKYVFSKRSALSHGINYYRANCGQLYLKDSSPKEYPPGLLLFGEFDGYLSLGFLKLAKKKVPNLRTFIVKGTNHFVQQNNPADTNRAMKVFLGETDTNIII